MSAAYPTYMHTCKYIYNRFSVNITVVTMVMSIALIHVAYVDRRAAAIVVVILIVNPTAAIDDIRRLGQNRAIQRRPGIRRHGGSSVRQQVVFQ